MPRALNGERQAEPRQGGKDKKNKKRWTKGEGINEITSDSYDGEASRSWESTDRWEDHRANSWNLAELAAEQAHECDAEENFAAGLMDILCER